MEHSTDTQERKDRTSQRRQRWPFRHRALALILTLTMLLSSSGLITLAAQAEGGEENSSETSTVTVSEEALTAEASEDETDVTALVEQSTAAATSEESEPTSPEPSQEPSAEPSEATVTEETATQATIDGSAGDSDNASVPAAASLDDDDDATEETTEQPAEESAAVTSTRRGARAKVAAASTDYDITDLMTTDSYIKIQLVDGGEYYTISELNAKGLKVPKGANVFVHLEWDKIPDIQAGQNLVYQIPDGTVSNIVEEPRFMFSDAKKKFAGYMTLTSDGLFTVEIDSSYFNKWANKQSGNTLKLDYLTLDFYATLSTTHGETSGSNDEVITFKGSTTGTAPDPVQFTIPFEYKNEHSRVEVTKESKFNPVTQSIDYTITVTAPDTNTLTAENVKLTDKFEDTTYLVAASGSATGVYRDIKAFKYASAADAKSETGGTQLTDFVLNRSKGILTIGDMEPGSVVVLTYSASVSNDYFANTVYPTINNSAQASYNDTTSNMETTKQACGGSAKIAKSVGSIVTEDDGDTYLEYKLTVTAYGVVSGLAVEDYFTESWDAISRLDDFDGQVDYDPDNNPTHKFTWTINQTLTDKQTVTLTYKAYLNPSAWKPDGTSSTGDPIQKRLIIKNQADLKLGDDLIGSATGKSDITKQWVNKSGSKDNSGKLNYTVKVNSDPVAKDITSIYDNLSSESAAAGATIEYPIKVTVYTSSSSSKKQVTSFDLSSSTTGFTASDTGWRLDLTSYDGGSLNNKGYYYVITYSVNGGSANNVINGAGINRGEIGYGVSTTVEAKSINATKTRTAANYLEGYISWETTMQSDIDAGTVYYDWLDDDKVGDDTDKNKIYAGFWWYTMEDIEGVEVYQKVNGQEVLIYGKDENGDLVNPYNVSVEVYDYKNADNPYKRQPVTIPYWTYTENKNGTFDWNNDITKYGKIGYYGFKVTFSQAIKVENVGDVIVRYNCSTCWEDMYHYAMTHERNNGTTNGSKNSYQIDADNQGKWVSSTGVTKQFGYYSGQPGVRISVYGLADVLKGSTYDPTTGIITWKVYINHQGDMIGDATVEDLLPKGLEFLSATLTVGNDSGSGKTYVDKNFDTYNGNSKYGSIKQIDGEDAITVEKLSTGETKLTVLLENLHGFNGNTYKMNKDGTYVLDDNGMPTFVKTNDYGNGWYDDGNVVLTIQTRVVDTEMVSGVTQKFTNQVTVTNATMASGSCTTYATQEVTPNKREDSISKNMGTYTAGTTLTFTLNVNENGKDLIYTPEKERGTSTDTLEILDEMSDKMTLATHQTGYFKVVATLVDQDGNETPKELTAATSAEIDSDHYYVTKVDGAAGKNTYRIIVPDGVKLTITYKVVVDAAVGEKPQITNTAYFNYNGLNESKYSAEYKDSFTIQKASGSTNASADKPSFQIFKQDQWGNPIQGVTFALYQVELNDDGTAGTETYVSEAVTDKDGLVTFQGLDDLENEDAIYCFYETSVPTGYEKSNDPTYFYFIAKDGMNVNGAIGIGYTDKVFEVTNKFSSASLSVPLQKTINGETLQSSSQFGFTLKSTKTPNGASVYTDQACTSANKVTDDGVTATIEGSGTTNVDTVYFNTVGTYEFTLEENALSVAQTKAGFGKDDTVYTITVEVKNDENTGLYVASATFKNADGTKSDDLENSSPVFNNTLTLQPVQVTLNATKKLEGANRESMKAGEFKFEAMEDDKVVATGTIEADADNDNISKVVFDAITYGAKDLGTHILTIYEVEGSDLTITYSDVIFFATVKVDTVDGSDQLTADVTYSTQFAKNLDENNQPVFINTYTPISQTGIRNASLPFAMMAVMAGSAGAVMMVRKWKRRKARV
jgi:pilin isopeptide linkage protein